MNIFSYFLCEGVVYLCMVYAHICVQVLTPLHMCGGQKMTSSVVFYSSPPYSFEAGSLTGSEVGHQQSNCLYFIYNTGCVVIPSILCGSWGIRTQKPMLCSEHSCHWAVSPTCAPILIGYVYLFFGGKCLLRSFTLLRGRVFVLLIAPMV